MTALHDEKGQIIGYFVTPAEAERRKKEAESLRSMYEWAKAQFTDEELEKARQDPEEFTIEEVLKYVESQ
jgi:hypothetical protein